MTIRIQYGTKKNSNLSDKFLMELYAEWRKVAYGLPGSRNRNTINFGTKKLTLFVVQEEELRMLYNPHSKWKELTYDVYTLGIQGWHYRKDRAKKASNVMSVLCLQPIPRNGMYYSIFQKIKDTGSF